MDNNKKDTKSLNLYKEFSTKYIKLSKKEFYTNLCIKLFLLL